MIYMKHMMQITHVLLVNNTLGHIISHTLTIKPLAFVFLSTFIQCQHPLVIPPFLFEIRIGETMVDPTLCTVISFIFISHAMLWMQTVDYKARQKMIGNYRIILGRFHGY
eukprot:1033969_1